VRKTHLFWFTQDLRLSDNPGLEMACDCDRLLLVYCIDPAELKPNRYGLQGMSLHRLRFLYEGLIDLDQQLRLLDQNLLICMGNPVEVLSRLIQEHEVDHVFTAEHSGSYERKRWQILSKRFENVAFTRVNNLRIFEIKDLPFSLENLPSSFSGFRKRVESFNFVSPCPQITHMPTSVTRDHAWPVTLARPEADPASAFHGGETHGLNHLNQYFASSAPQTYIETRNALDNWEHSTKLSPWLAQGSLSVRQTLQALREHEAQQGANDSTYWIFFELLWREYFQLYALKHNTRLFNFAGCKNNAPLTSFYPQRFRAWCEGNTPYAAVNACMRQLKATGYMSNRGRQWVASCLVNELGLDWRYGAAYFEQQLLDYDVASNWGNWQYLAGVGADPRGPRHFNLEKQSQMHDPTGEFIQHWGGKSHSTHIDTVDAADWPIMGH